jgi:hypothetical protein
VSLGTVRTRILVAVCAWSLGAAAATGGAYLAVSRLGEGFTSAPSQQLTVAMVRRALASEAAETSAPAATTPAPTPSVKLGGTATPITRRHAPPTHTTAPAPAASPSPQSPGGTVLSSQGGTIVAGCESAGAYLESWSPQQGFEAKSVVRGPGATAQVAFRSSQSTVTMMVSCSAGVPSATTQVQNSWGGDD